MRKLLIGVGLILIIMIGGFFYFNEVQTNTELDGKFSDGISQFVQDFGLVYFNETSESEGVLTLVGDTGISISKRNAEFYIEMPTAVGFLDDGSGNISVDYGDYTGLYYMKDSNTFEWEMHVDRSPPQDCYTFNINSSNLEFYYQPALSLEEVPEATSCNATDCIDSEGNNIAHRPENVIGSYAMYSPEGKFGHLYRPFVYHSKGFNWLTWNITENTSEICGFDAIGNVRDLIIGPTFGYTSNPVSASTGTAGTSYMTYSEPYVFTATHNVTINSYSWYGHNGWSGTDIIQMAVYNMTTWTNPEERAHETVNITIDSSTAQWWTNSSVSISLVEDQDYSIGFGSDTGTRVYYDRTSDHEQISGVMPQTWDATPSSTNDFTYGTQFNYTQTTACDSGVCDFGPGYLLEDIQLETGFATPPTSTAGQMKWNISDFCDTGETLTNAYLQLYIYQKAGTPDSDVNIEYVRDQTWTEATSTATFDAQTMYNSTTLSMSSTTQGTFTNISITTQLNEACNRDEFLSIRFDDPDNALGTVDGVNDGTYIMIGDDNLFSPPDSFYRFYTREYTTDITQRPRIFAEWDATPPSLNEFIAPTIISGITNNNWLYFNMTLNETSGSSGDSLIVEVDGVNNTVCSACPPSPPQDWDYNKTSLDDGNHTFALWTNGNRWDENWAVTETGSGVEVNLVSPSNGAFQNTPVNQVNVSCNATAPSGIINITLEGDFGRMKHDLQTLQTYTPTGNPSFAWANFTVNGIAINDTYNWNCEVNTVANNTKQADNNWSVGIGTGKIYVVRAVDTETWNREDQDDVFYQNLSLESYIITDFDNLSNATANGPTANYFDYAWRGDWNDTSNDFSKYTWYMMTHESHGHASNTQGQVDSPIGYNIIANIMFGNGTVYYDYDGLWKQLVEDFGDNYAWHNHHSTWNGTSDNDPSGYWVGTDSNTEFWFNGTELFYDNDTNETDFVRAEKLVAQFAYDNALDWTSFRAGWLVTGSGEHNTNYMNFLGNNTALDYTPTSALSGNMWEEIRYRNTDNTLIGFRCDAGSSTQAKINNAFEYAQNGSRMVVCTYSHNYGTSLDDDTELVWSYLNNAYGTYGVDWEWETDIGAAQKYYRVTDFTKPVLTLSSDANFLYVESNEPLHMAPAISVLIDNGTTTNYTLHYPEENGTNKWKLSYSGISMVSFRARGTDTSFNVATASADVNLDIIDPTESSPYTITNESRNITVRWRMYNGGVEITTGVLGPNITVGGFNCVNLTTHSYISGAWQMQCNTSTSLSNDNYYNLYVEADHLETPKLSETEIDAIFLAPADSCTYSGSGDWVIQCDDNCVIDTPTNLLGNDLLINGSGLTMFSSLPYNYNKVSSVGISPSQRCLIRVVI